MWSPRHSRSSSSDVLWIALDPPVVEGAFVPIPMHLCGYAFAFSALGIAITLSVDLRSD